MSLTENLIAYKQIYQEAREKMPKGTQAILLLSHIQELNDRERRTFVDAIESLIENVGDWVYTFTLFGQMGFCLHCAINPHTVTEAALDGILGNFIGDPEKLKIEYY